MKKILVFLLFTFHFSLFTSLCYAQTGTWTAVTNLAPHDNMGVCLLMTDGTVICHNTHGATYGTGWDRLTPDIHGSYVNGTWDTIASMHHDRLFFSSQVLPNGNVYVAAGEYGNGDTAGEVYNPLTNTWSIIPGVPLGWDVFDGNSELLYNGNVLEGPQYGNDPSFNTLIYNPGTGRYSIGPNAYYTHYEASWLKLRDSSVLFVGANSVNSNRYIPQLNKWVHDGNVPGDLYDASITETGPAFMLPNGKALFTGGNCYNALYTPSGDTLPGTWASADSFPVIGTVRVATADASGAVMNNGHVLIAVSPWSGTEIEARTPIYFVEYDYTTNTFAQVTSIIPTFGADSLAGLTSFQTQMLVLPDGNILVSISQSSSSRQYFIYTPGSGPIPQGKPTIDNITNISCSNYRVTGKLFNGISEGAGYGDDWQMSTNYPLVRLTDGTNVYYAKTSNWNRKGAIETDSLEDTVYFPLPSMPGGTYSVVVAVNGFASNPVMLSTFGVAITSYTTLSACNTGSGSATATASGGGLPYTYLWTPSGGTNPTASGLTAGVYTITVTDSAGCSMSASVNISHTTALTASASGTPTLCNGLGSGSITASVSGGTPPYTYLWNPGSYTSAFENWLTAATYTVLVTDSCGVTATAAATVTQPSALVIVTDSVDASKTDSCGGQASVTVSGGVPPYYYLWTPGSKITQKITGLCPGNYCCQVTDNNGCFQTVCIEVIAGINQLSVNSGQLSVYPNPNNGVFTVALGHAKLVSALQPIIEIYNVLGEAVYDATLKQVQGDNRIDISNQPNGIYFYRVLNTDGSVLGSGKLINQK